MKRMMKLKKSIILSVLTIGFAMIANAQDGQEIYESKCAVCHILGKDATGPNLIGIKAKWEGEERSEERRVGKEWRSRRARDHERKKKRKCVGYARGKEDASLKCDV